MACRYESRDHQSAFRTRQNKHYAAAHEPSQLGQWYPRLAMQYEYVSWNRFYRLCGVLWRRISKSGYQPDLIIAITRGGYPTARVLADYYGLMDLVSLKIEHYHGPSKQETAVVPYPLPLSVTGRSLLLVDDVSDSGDTFEAAFAELARHGTPRSLRTAVLHHKKVSRYAPDFHAQRVDKWRWITYPWALVEDLTHILAQLTPAPERAADVEKYLADEIGMRLPRSILDQAIPVVLQRLEVSDRSSLR